MLQNEKPGDRLIVPEMTIADALACRPGAVTVLARRKMACPGCSMAGFETLLEVAEIYQIRVEDLIQEIKESD